MRIEGKGRIDRARRVAFTFDGHRHEGFAGDTLASALLADGVRVMGRSFKYHRPRGVMTAGSEEPNALVTLGLGAAQVPNCRATTVELSEGLMARSQNRWPSLGFDVMAVNDLMAPFFGAGFYYKTFMWPRRSGKSVYEPAIRRAAGLGALSGEAAPDRYERAYAHCDLLVIGGGPAGLMAAWAAAEAGADVILAEEDVALGGRLLAETEEVDGQDGAAWAAEMAAALDAMPNVRIMTRTAVTGAYDGGTFGALERIAPDIEGRPHAPAGCFWRIAARRAVLAAGALERPVAFGNNDRPGVMMAGAVRAYLNRWGVAAGRSVVVFGNNDSAHRTVAICRTRACMWPPSSMRGHTRAVPMTWPFIPVRRSPARAGARASRRCASPPRAARSASPPIPSPSPAGGTRRCIWPATWGHGRSGTRAARRFCRPRGRCRG